MRHVFADITMSVSLSEICENTKMGREYALLGNYETSQVYYQAVLQQIQKLLTSINDQARKSKWNQVIFVCAMDKLHACRCSQVSNHYKYLTFFSYLFP